MAAGTKLSVTFGTADGSTTMSFSMIDPETDPTDLQNVANTVVTNGIIYNKIPTSVKSMKLVTTTETDVPIS